MKKQFIVSMQMDNGIRLLISEPNKTNQQKALDSDWKLVQAKFLVERHKVELEAKKSRYESEMSNPFVRGQIEQQAFDCVKEEVTTLAKAGNLHAIAFYLSHVENGRDAQIVEKAYEATNLPVGSEISPEQLEVKASLNFFDDFGEYYNVLTRKNQKLTSFRMLIDAHDDAWIRNYLALVKEDGNEEYKKTKEEQVDVSARILSTQQHALASSALLGYYGRCFIGDKPTVENLDEYLFLANETHGALQEQDLFGYVSKVLKFPKKKSSANNADFYENRQHMANALLSACKNKQNMDEYLALAKSYALYQTTKLYFEDMNVKKNDLRIKKGFTMLENVGKIKYFSPEMQIYNMSNRTKNTK